jgi:hypothetical protein
MSGATTSDSLALSDRRPSLAGFESRRHDARISAGSYVKLVEYTGRLYREGKASISAEVAGIFKRMGSSAHNWQTGMERLCGDRLLGRFFAASALKLREIAERLGMWRLVNLVGCPIR